VFLFVVRFLNYTKKGTNEYSNPTSKEFWNLPSTSELLARAWQLMEDREALKTTVSINQAAFKRFATMFGFPPALKSALA